MREGFDNDKYIELQAERIRERVEQFGGKIGGRGAEDVDRGHGVLLETCPAPRRRG